MFICYLSIVKKSLGEYNVKLAHKVVSNIYKKKYTYCPIPPIILSPQEQISSKVMLLRTHVIEMSFLNSGLIVNKIKKFKFIAQLHS